MTKTEWYKILEIYSTKTKRQRERFRFKITSADTYKKALAFLNKMKPPKRKKK